MSKRTRHRQPHPQKADVRASAPNGGRSPTYVELPTRTVAEWTPDGIRSALTQADTGYLTRPADLVESLQGDDRVQGVLSTRTHGLLGLPVDFIGSKSRVIKALKGVPRSDGNAGVPGDFHKMLPECELAKLVSWGIVLGVGLGELVPTETREISGGEVDDNGDDKGERETPRLKIWHPRYLRHQWDDDTWHLSTNEGEIEITPGDGRWILYTPYGLHRPWVSGAWRPLAFAWVLKQFALHDRARHSEVQGSAARVGFAPQGATEGQRKKMLRDIRSMARDNSIVLPDGYDYKVVEATGRTWEIYSEQIDWADRAMAVTLAGQAVTTDGTTGFSNGNIHAAIKQDLIEFTAVSLAACLREQVFEPWASWNFGDPELAPFAVWDCAPPDDKKTMAEAHSLLGDAITKLDFALSASGQRVDAIALVGKFGIPLVERDDPDPALAPVAAVPPADGSTPPVPAKPPSAPAAPKPPMPPVATAHFTARRAFV